MIRLRDPEGQNPTATARASRRVDLIAGDITGVGG